MFIVPATEEANVEGAVCRGRECTSSLGLFTEAMIFNLICKILHVFQLKFFCVANSVEFKDLGLKG